MRTLQARELTQVAGGDDVAIGPYVYTSTGGTTINNFLDMGTYTNISVNETSTNGIADGGGSISITKADGSSMSITCPTGTIPIALQGSTNTQGDASLIKSILTGIGFNISGSFQAGGCKPNGQNGTSSKN